MTNEEQPREYGPILRVRLPLELKQALDEEVKRRHSTRSAIVKQILAYYLSFDHEL